MDYISAEKFLRQSKKVQKVLLDWWNPEYADLIGESNGDFCLVSELMSPSRPKVFKYKYINSKIYVPLFTEGQLRKFIEEKTGYKVDVDFYKEDGYDFLLTNGAVGTIYKSYRDLGHDLLQAYWDVACKIADEIEPSK